MSLNLRTLLFANSMVVLMTACQLKQEDQRKKAIEEITKAEKAFNKRAAEKGIAIRLMEQNADDDVKANFEENAPSNFGLVFVVGIYEQLPNGEYVYNDQSPLYAEVAKMGQSIGLTWVRDKKAFSSWPRFELRPAWAVQMKETEMVKELSRRKQQNLNLLAIL